MLKPRNQRVHTDYSKASSTFADRKPTRQSNSRKLTTPSDREDYISRALDSLNHQVPYDSLSLQQIEAERLQLKLKVKEINALMNVIVTKQMDRRFDESRVSNKATIGQDMGMDRESLLKEAEANRHKIETLQEELQENMDRLAGFNNIEAKIDHGRKVGELEIRIKELRQQLGRIRKNKFMRQKQIMKGSAKQEQLLHSLQQEYISSTRKLELITSRFQNIQQELADTDFSLQKQKDYYEELRTDCLLIDCSTDKQHPQEEMLAAYNLKKRKLELASKKAEKDAEAKKKKYYNLLLQYQELTSRHQSVHEKITATTEKNEQALQVLSKMLEHLKSISLKQPKRLTQQVLHHDTQLFELTRPNDDRQYASGQKSPSSFSNKLLVQNQLNKGNARNRSFVRKWKLEGSIVHQNISNQKKFLQSIRQTESGQEEENQSPAKSGTAHEPRESRERNRSKQIRHFKTESSPHRTHLKGQLPQEEEEEYQSDFQL